MKNKNKYLLITIISLLILSVAAIDFTPKGNINLQSRYNITNAVNIFSEEINLKNITPRVNLIDEADSDKEWTISLFNGDFYIGEASVSNWLQIDKGGLITMSAITAQGSNIPINKLNWGDNWTNYPTACPAGEAITALGDSVTCTAFSGGGDQSVNTDSNVTFASTAITSATASRLTSFDANKNLTSVADLTSWIAGTANKITVTDDADGTITLTLPDLVALVQLTVTPGSAVDAININQDYDDQSLFIDSEATTLQAIFVAGQMLSNPVVQIRGEGNNTREIMFIEMLSDLGQTGDVFVAQGKSSSPSSAGIFSNMDGEGPAILLDSESTEKPVIEFVGTDNGVCTAGDYGFYEDSGDIYWCKNGSGTILN